MKTLIPFATVLLLAACAAPPRVEAPLQAQAPAPMGMEGPSSIGQNIIGTPTSRTKSIMPFGAAHLAQVSDKQSVMTPKVPSMALPQARLVVTSAAS